MEKTTKVLSIILLLTFSVIFNHCAPGQKTQVTPTYVEEAPKTIEKIYFKDGEVIQCDIVWEGMGSQILCKKSEDILAYSAGDVDLIRTFGQSSATEIAKRYEERVKHRELMSRPNIVTPEQERLMREREVERARKIAAELKALKITQEKIDVEKRVLIRRSEWNKISELERDPALYFKNKDEEKYKKETEYYKKKIQGMEQEVEHKIKNLGRKMQRFNYCWKNCIRNGKSDSYCERKCARYRYW